MRIPNANIPEEIFDQHTIVLGKTRSGKSSVMRLLVEHLLDDDRKPVCVIDPKGDWWGLKSSASGKRAGYPVIIFGGEHADVPLNPRSGAAVAELVATGNRPCIVDLGGWMPGDRTQFWIDFASMYFRAHRGRHYLVIDEVHNLCPKGKIMDPNAGKMLHWSNRLASEGLGKGISMIAASQRPQKVHNDFLTSCETLFAMRVIHKADRDALGDWIDGCGDPEKGDQLITTIASMKRGEAWVWSPEAEFGPRRIQFPMFTTYDSFKAQGAKAVKLRGWADVDLADVRKKLESAVKEAEANDPKLLKIKIAELTRQLKTPAARPAAAKEIVRTVVDQKAIDRAVRPLQAVLEGIFHDLGHASAKIRKALDRKPLPAIPAPARVRAIQPPPEMDRAIRSVRREQANGDLPVGEHAVLVAIGRYDEGVEREQLTVLAGYKKTSRDVYIGRLRGRGYCDVRGDRIVITPEGVRALGVHFNPQPADAESLREYWMEKLPLGEKKILQILLDARGAAVERETLTLSTGYKKTSRDVYIGRLNAKRLIETVGRGQVKAATALL